MSTKMTIIITILVLLAAAAAYYIYGPQKPNKQAALTVGGVTFNVEIASTTVARAQGLSGRDGLGEREGMLFAFGIASRYDFWMKDMKFPIDIVWIKDNRVIGFTENVQPEPGKSIFMLKTYAPPEPVKHVLELNAGAAKKFNIQVGDVVRF